ncbi:hypothetical protein ACM16X_04910 [Haloarcula japonica]|uniref:hypothetical protein n=1 Tax=Haloarcula japonica TaxID=29282 RepID=UPI0039F6F125
MSQARGNRLPGDSESADRHKSEERAEARLSGELAARFTDYVEAHGLAKSEVVREALDEYLPASERSQYILPRDPKLADAYLALAGDEKRLLSVERVESILCETSHPNTPKKLIKEDVLEPLESTGLIGIRYGTVAVHPLTPRTEAVADV